MPQCSHKLSDILEIKKPLFVFWYTAQQNRLEEKENLYFKSCCLPLTCFGYPLQHSLWSQNHGVWKIEKTIHESSYEINFSLLII